MSYFGSIYRDNELTSRASNVYRYLADRANSDGQCWPSERTIAQDLKISNYPDKKILTCFLFQFKKIRFANKLSGNIGRCAKFFIQF